ncbi:GNAT family N-acetyltransferase [Aliiroseovarius sp.]|uniref:GNAT family N-acetyltransferase n=1 Tax=Aliiroseovarius sp. TaxID=1872442 RepID=UPI0026129CE8|nr:GNAT family N-acetyltransferase [Aliiroseovarius sp.]
MIPADFHIDTPRLTLRLPRMEDFPTWEAFAASKRAQYIGGPYDKRNAWRAFAHVAGQWMLRGYGSFVFCEKGSDKPLGLTGPWHPEDWPEREIGWTVWSPEAEGKGYAFEAALAARAHAFETLGWDTAVSYIDADNARSIALAERLGCTLDEDAEKPDSDLPPCLVYRHPAPDADGSPEAYA